MNRWFALAIITMLLVWAAAASADLITIDGDDSDWTDPDSAHDDPVGDVRDGNDPPNFLYPYDIDYTYFKWDGINNKANFMAQTVEPITDAYEADFVEIIINADDDETTGAPNYHDAAGADYYLSWSLDGDKGTTYEFGSSQTPTWYEWNGSSFSLVLAGLDANDLVIAYDDVGTDYSVIEVAINGSLFGSPDAFTWGMYLDNGTTASDDASPNDYSQRGYTPEPTTLVLLPLGLAGLAVWRRRREG